MSKEFETGPMGHDHDKEMATLHLDNHSAHSNDGTLAGQGDIVKCEEERHPMTAEERAGALKVAMELDPGPDILSWRYMYFVFTAFIAILNSGDNGQLLIYPSRSRAVTNEQVSMERSCHPLIPWSSSKPISG